MIWGCSMDEKVFTPEKYKSAVMQKNIYRVITKPNLVRTDQ